MAAEPPAPPPVGPPALDTDPYGPWGYQPWMEPPPAPSRRGARLVVSLLLIAAVAAGAAAGVAVLIGRGSGLSFVASAPGGAVSGSVDQVDQAIVDVTSRLTGDQGIAAGTGMVLTSSGEVLTNNHVVAGGAAVTVQIDGAGPQYNASVVGVDPVNDIAVLQMQGASGLAHVTLGDSSKVGVGDAVTAIGNALGQGGTPVATSGAVTGLDQTITVSDDMGGTETLDHLIEMNAQIQRGDSGGPLIDSGGKVVGMDTAAEVAGRRSVSTAGYAIPINTAIGIVHQIEQGGGGSSTVQTGTPPIIGVDVAAGSDTGGGGVSVSGVQPNSPAARAGIQMGDTIISIDGGSVATSSDLRTAIRAHKVGDHVTVAWVDTAGQTHSASLQLVAGPPA